MHRSERPVSPLAMDRDSGRNTDRHKASTRRRTVSMLRSLIEACCDKRYNNEYRARQKKSMRMSQIPTNKANCERKDGESSSKML